MVNTIVHCLLVGVLCFPDAMAGTEKYSVKNIPAQLLPADAVIRDYSIEFEIYSPKKAIQKVTYAVTIFTKEERHRANLVLPYNKFITIDDLEGTLFDKQGREIRDIRKAEIKDYSAIDDYTLHDDSRVRYIAVVHDVFPYTVEYTYEIEYNGYLNFPAWYSRENINPVERTVFRVTTPSKYLLRYWTNKDSIRPVTVESGRKASYIWEAANLPKLSRDAVDEDLYDVSTIVRIAPSDFEIENVKGDMSSWKDFGGWFYKLKDKRSSLPASAVFDIQEIVKASPSKRETVKKIYEYMQSRTRYISVQLGIGGWQPFDASYVHNRGYGDCKALTNYMESLLRLAEIPSFPVLINSGTDRFPMITEFPSNQFNHVILCVPMERDSVWLECTNQSKPFGRLGYTTENRNALLISYDGGFIVRTPATGSDDNLQIRTGKIYIQSTGTAVVNISTRFYGNRHNETQSTLIQATPEERENWVKEQFTAPNISLHSFSIQGLENRSPEIVTDISASLLRYSSVSNDRIFFHPSIISRRTYIPPPVDKRLSPVRFPYPYKNIDSLWYTLPSHYIPETIPPALNVQTTFGSYSSKSISLGDTAVLYIRMTEMNMNSIPAERYQEYRSFIADIVRSDRAQIVLRKK
jgi:transglutaminase-like putative cysteine protease